LAGERYDVSENAIPLLERLRTRDVSARPQLANDAGAQLLFDGIFRWQSAQQQRLASEWADVRMAWQLGIAELRELISFVSSLPPREDRDSPPYRPTATREPKFDVTLGILILRFSSESVSHSLFFVEMSYIQLRSANLLSTDNSRGSFADLAHSQVWMDAGSSSTVQEF